MTLLEFFLKYGGLLGWILLIIGSILLIYEIAMTLNSPKRVRRPIIIGHVLIVSLLLSTAITLLIFFSA